MNAEQVLAALTVRKAVQDILNHNQNSKLPIHKFLNLDEKQLTSLANIMKGAEIVLEQNQVSGEFISSSSIFSMAKGNPEKQTVENRPELPEEYRVRETNPTTPLSIQMVDE